MKRLTLFLFITMVLLVPIWLFIANYLSTEHRIERIRNLKILALSLGDYELDHGHYPPNIEFDSSGKAVQSWRGLVADFASGPPFPYDVRQPWDSAVNRAFLNQMPPAFRSSLSTGPENCTSYLAVTGPGTIWNDGHLLTQKEYLDLPEDTLELVEVPDSGVRWAEPRDTTFEEFLAWWQKARVKYAANPPLALLHNICVVPLSDELVAKLTQFHESESKKDTANGEPPRK